MRGGTAELWLLEFVLGYVPECSCFPPGSLHTNRGAWGIFICNRLNNWEPREKVASFYLKLLPPRLGAPCCLWSWYLATIDDNSNHTSQWECWDQQREGSYRNLSRFPFQSHSELRWQLKKVASRVNLWELTKGLICSSCHLEKTAKSRVIPVWFR